MKQKQTVLYCFSPPVMVATFLIESALLIYVLWRYKLNPLTRVAASLLALLATFQLAEYYVCEGSSMSAGLWSRIGFVAITLLPPLGLHLMHLIAKKRQRAAVYGAYATSIFWVLLFGTSTWAFTGHACNGNYAIFHLRFDVTIFYGLYYYGWLFYGVFLATYLARRVKKPQAQALALLALGYLTFMLPTIVANTLNPETLRGVPSIMCGFAVLFAILLSLGVIPGVAPQAKKGK